MHPTIWEGEAITVEPVDPSGVKRGDILLYRSCRGVTAHRVVGIERKEENAMVFILRGDASGKCDAPVRPAQLLGRVVFVHRGGRPVDLASRRAKALFAARFCGARLKVGFLRVFRPPITRWIQEEVS